MRKGCERRKNRARENKIWICAFILYIRITHLHVSARFLGFERGHCHERIHLYSCAHITQRRVFLCSHMSQWKLYDMYNNRGLCSAQHKTLKTSFYHSKWVRFILILSAFQLMRVHIVATKANCGYTHFLLYFKVRIYF